MAKIFVVNEICGGSIGGIDAVPYMTTCFGVINSVTGDVLDIGGTGLYNHQVQIDFFHASGWGFPTGINCYTVGGHDDPYANVVPISGVYQKASGPVLHSF